MKKFGLILLTLIMIFNVTACNDKKEEKKEIKQEEIVGLQPWPKDSFFADIPALVDEVFINKTENDKGEKYVLEIADISYKKLRSWILNLESKGYTYPYTAQLFPEDVNNLPKDVVSWSSEKLVNGIYISAVYDKTKAYEKDPRVIITILNYDPLA